MKNMGVKALVAMVATVVCGTASATLIGDTVHVTGDVGDGLEDFGFLTVADPGVELFLTGPLGLTLDIFADSIEISVHNTGPAVLAGGGFLTIGDLDWGVPGVITGLDVLVDTWDPVLDLSFTADSVTFERSAVTELASGNTWTVVVGLEHQPIPEPATVALLSLGLLGMAARRKFAA